MVDDDPDILGTLGPLLQRRLGPCEVATAPSGEAARQRLEAEAFDLVLTDERMPGMSGSELLAWVRSHRPGTSRVLMSAFTEGFGTHELEARGAEAFFRKPLDLEKMVPRLKEMLEEPEA